MSKKWIIIIGIIAAIVIIGGCNAIVRSIQGPPPPTPTPAPTPVPTKDAAAELILQHRANSEFMEACPALIVIAHDAMNTGVSYKLAVAAAAPHSGMSAEEFSRVARLCAAALGYETVGKDLWEWMDIDDRWKYF